MSATSRPIRADSPSMSPRNRRSRVLVPGDVGLPERGRVAVDGGERGAQLVGEVRQELALEDLRAPQRRRLGLGRLHLLALHGEARGTGRRRRAGRACRSRCSWARATRPRGRAGPGARATGAPTTRVPTSRARSSAVGPSRRAAAAATSSSTAMGSGSDPARPVAARRTGGPSSSSAPRRATASAASPSHSTLRAGAIPSWAACGPVSVSSIPRMRLEDAVAAGDLSEQSLASDRRRRQVRVERDQLEGGRLRRTDGVGVGRR